MSTTEFDVPLLPSAEQIRRRNFATVRRGFDPDQVRDYLWQVADQIEQLESRLREARMELEAGVPAPARDPYEELGSRVADLIRAADAEAESLKHRGELEADRLVSEARAEADRIRADAQVKAEEARSLSARALQQARAEADRTLAGLASRRESLIEQLQTMQERLVRVAAELGSSTGIPGDGASQPAADAPSPAEPSRVEPSRNEPSQAGRSSRSAGQILDPSYEDLWSGGGEIEFEMPGIPHLDLSQLEDEDETVD